MMFNNGFVAGVCGGTPCDKQNKEMKTLVNKRNSQLKITAPDGMVKNRTNCWAIWSEGDRLMLLDKDNWTLVEEQPTCKPCGFYENNCPFIRGKFLPYPSRVCKDYTNFRTH